MYKNKIDCKKHYDILEKCVNQQDQFYELNSKVVTLTTLPDMMTDMFIMFRDQQNMLADLVEDKIITVEMFFYDLSKLQLTLQKDIGDLKKRAIKNDPTLSPDQKVSLISEGASFDTLEGSLHKEMTNKALARIVKKGGGGGLFGFGKPPEGDM